MGGSVALVGIGHPMRHAGTIISESARSTIHRLSRWSQVPFNDPFNLDRFVQAQRGVYDQACREIRAARKRSHWMWYIFPQYAGLGTSSTSRKYAIRSRAEAEAYLRHPMLGPRLVECAEVVLAVEGRTAHEIFGSPDDRKLRSCATLFAIVSPSGSVFHRLLDKYFQGELDDKTHQLLDLDGGRGH